MARPRTLPDSDVYAAILALIARDGEKSVTFSSVAQATGLAGASLVQRYGGLPAMVEAAMDWGWDRLEALTAEAEAEVAASDKGTQTLLKSLSEKCATLPLGALLAASLRNPRLRLRANGWRARFEASLAARLHDRDRAAMLFALWQGQLLWDAAGEKGFRLKDALKRLG